MKRNKRETVKTCGPNSHQS